MGKGHITNATILMRIKSASGESCYFKDDTGRFSSDIDKNYTLKVKVQTAYKLTFECPKNLRIISLSIDGCPVTMEDVPGQRPDADKVLIMGVWRTDTHFATDVSKREKIEFVFVTQVDGASGPESDERYLLKKKLLIKFYNPDYAKYTEKGYALGAIRFRCSIAEGGASKITSVHFADALHVEKLRRDEEEHDYVSTAHLHKQNNKMIEIINMKRPGSAEEDGEEDEGGAGSRGRRKSADDEATCESALEILALPGSASGTPVGAVSAEKKNPGGLLAEAAANSAAKDGHSSK